MPRYISIVAIAVVGIFLWHGNHPLENKLSMPAAVTAVPDQPAGQLPDLIPVVTDAVASNAVASTRDPFEETMALIHLKSRQWSETQTGDRETQDRLQNELLAMLTDDNAAEIIQSLSPEELDSPFGVSALFHWMKMDPVTAANWVASRPDACAGAGGRAIRRRATPKRSGWPGFAPCDQRLPGGDHAAGPARRPRRVPVRRRAASPPRSSPTSTRTWRATRCGSPRR